MNKFPNRPPLQMNGMAKALGFGAPQPKAVQPPVLPRDDKHVSDSEAQAALDRLLNRLKLAEWRVELGMHYVSCLLAQAATLPEGDPVREVCERMLMEIRGALKKEPPNATDAG